jgi:short-subunit dehydrogenase
MRLRAADPIAGKWALVTGASSGLGVEFATLLAERHANLVLVARRTDLLQQLAARLRREHPVSVLVEGLDLSTAGSATALKERLDAHGVAVDVLVNNAGYGLYGDFVEQPLRQTTTMLALNVVSMTELTGIFAADMVRRGTGYILLVASLLGYQPVPGYAAYAASKAYVLHFGEALHDELEPHGVVVTVLAPGAAATAFVDVAHQRDTRALRLLMMQPRPVAAIGIEALLRGRSSVVAGVRNKLIALSNRFTPRRIQRLIFQRVFSGNGQTVNESSAS